MVKKNNDSSVFTTEPPLLKVGKVKKTASLRTIGVLSSLLMSLAALVLAFYAYYQTWKQYELNYRLQKNMQGLVSEVSHKQEALAKQIAEVAKTAVQATVKQPYYEKQEWFLLKVRYYLEMAQVNAHWGNNVASTISLMEAANTVLQPMTDQRILTIRQTIDHEIAQLKALPSVDIVSLLSQLDATQAMVNGLIVNSTQTKEASQMPSSKQREKGWQDKLKSSLSILENLVVIQHHGQDPQPVFSPLYQTLLKENIRMNLQEAQWAVLQKNQTVYQQALQQAIDGVKRSFDFGSESTQVLLTQLEQLMQQNVAVTMPSLDKSLQQLNIYIEELGTQQ